MKFLNFEMFSGVLILLVAGTLFFGNLGSQIIPFTLGPRYFGFSSLTSLLKVKSALGCLGVSTASLVFALIIDVFDNPQAQLFYVVAALALYCSIFVIALARKAEADELVGRIRAARELPESKCFDADARKLYKSDRNAKDITTVLTSYDELLASNKRIRRSQAGHGKLSVWFALAFLILLPFYAYVYVDHNYENLKRYVEAVHPKTSVAGPLELMVNLYLSRGTTSCLDGPLTLVTSSFSIAAPSSESSFCAEANLKLQNLRGQTFVVGLLFIYFYFLIFFPLRYVAALFEYRALLRWSSSQGLGLETDVVQKSGLVVSLFISIVGALVLVNVPFGQIGVFSGIAAAGLSIALRDTLGNLLAGALLIWDGTLKKGDVITIPQSTSRDTGGTYGIVREMRMRYTVVEDRNTVRRLIPNSVLVANPIESWTHSDQKVRLNLRIGVAYGTDLREAKQIMESVCYDVPRILHDKPPQALVVNFGDSAIEFSLRFWLRDTSDGIRPVISEVLINLFERFDEVGIEIPFPQQDLHIRSIDEGGVGADAATRKA